MTSATLKVAAVKQKQREKDVSEMEDKLGKAADHPEDKLYLNTSPQEIVNNLRTRKETWTVERVMIAYIRAACAAHRKTNCLTEILFRDALKDAKLKDRELAISGHIEGAFWGLPSSFKDTFNICGVDSSLGLSIHCSQPTSDMEHEAGLVKLFRKAGGIPFCKTNVPQTLFAIECSNPIWGTSTHPRDAGRTPGGSSGGEAALLSLKGTPLGWGSDIGGSLRVPAHYVGCCALKPVRGRWPHSGCRPTVRGFDDVKVVEGPMARNVDDLIFASKSVLELVPQMQGSFQGETLMPIPWRDSILPATLKIGYFEEFEGIQTSPACVRAIRETVKKLEADGHELVAFDPPGMMEAFESFASITSADGYKSMLSNLGPDLKEPTLRLVTLGSLLPSWVHWLLCLLLRRILRDVVFANIFGVSKPKPVKDLWAANARKGDCTAAFQKAAWDEHQFDAVLCPVLAVPALELGRTTYLSPVAIGTVVWNVIDSTVGVLPVTRVDKSLDGIPADFLKHSKGSWLLEKRLYGSVDPAYDAAKMHGLPVGIQVVGRPWDDEKVLAVMRVIEGAVDYI